MLVGFLMAGKLGPYYMGIYGMVTLVLGYLAQFHFGISNSLNVYLVHNKKDQDVSDDYIANALLIISCISCLVILFYVVYLIAGWTDNEKYHIDNYLIWIIIIAVSEYYNSIFTCILRVKNKLNAISLYKIIYPVLGLICVLSFSGLALIYAIVITRTLSQFILLFIALKEKLIPNLRNVTFSRQFVGNLFSKGILLFIYNTCFLFVVISTRTIISNYYTVEEYGRFTFSYTVANAFMMLFSSLSFAIFPKIIDKLSSNDNNEIKLFLDTIYHIYIPSVHLLIYSAMLFFPLVQIVFPQYSNISVMLNLIALTIIMQTQGYGYSTLLIAKNMEKELAAISFSAMLLNVVLVMMMVKAFILDCSYVILASLIAFLYMTWVMCAKSLMLLSEYSWAYSIKKVISLKLLVPYIMALILSILDSPLPCILPLLVFVALNNKDIVKIKEMALRIARNPDATDIK